MRPYVVFHADAADVLRYLHKPDAQPVGGTVPNLGYKDLVKRFIAFGNDAMPEPYIHLTLSLPKGITATKKLWMRIVKTVLNAFGLDPDATPWFAARDTDRDCDHIHVAISLRDFTGRIWAVSLDRIKSDNIHQHLCAMLGLPVPDYFNPDAARCLAPVTPARNLKDKQRCTLFRDLMAVFCHAQPQTIASLNGSLAQQLGGFEVIEAPNRYGVDTLQYVNGDKKIYGRDLGLAWEPRFVKSRLQFCRDLRLCRYRLQLNNLVEIFRKPIMENHLARTITASQNARIATAASDRLRSAVGNAQESRGTLSSDRLVDGTRRPKRILGRETGGIADGPDADVANLSGRTSEDDHRDPRPHGDDRNDSQNRERAAGRNGHEAEHNPKRAEHTPRLTCGGLLARVCAVAKHRRHGWKARLMHHRQGVAIVFSDLSASVVIAGDVKIKTDGAEAQAFAQDYCAAWLANQNDQIEPYLEDNGGPEI